MLGISAEGLKLGQDQEGGDFDLINQLLENGVDLQKAMRFLQFYQSFHCMYILHSGVDCIWVLEVSKIILAFSYQTLLDLQQLAYTPKIWVIYCQCLTAITLHYTLRSKFLKGYMHLNLHLIFFFFFFYFFWCESHCLTVSEDYAFYFSVPRALNHANYMR